MAVHARSIIMKRIRFNQNGQTLLELLIALLILVSVIAVTVTLIVTSINAGRESTNKLIATNLAREGVEIVRNIRDSNWIDPSVSPVPNWDDGLVGGTTATLYVSISQPIRLYFDADQAQMYLYNDSYQQGSGVSGVVAQFFRTIKLNPICRYNSGDTSDSSDGDEQIASTNTSDNDCSGFGANYSEVGLKVISEVSWPSASSNKKVMIEDRLYNWQVL
jgi:type II secretory pathway pseudopilin PulG